MIKAVVFDIDGVLIDSLDANIMFYQKLLKKAGYKIPLKEEIAKTFYLTMWDAIKFLTKEKSDIKVKKVWDLYSSVKYPMHLLKIPGDSQDIVKTLKKTYKLALVTSRVRSGVKHFFEIFKLEKYFDIIVTFEDYTKPKPDPEPLLVAAKKLELKPSEAVYIGDGISDIKAAKAAGMKVIYYSNTISKEADATFKYFKDLPKIISQL